MGSETKSNSNYTEKTSAGDSSIKNSCCLVHQPTKHSNNVIENTANAQYDQIHSHAVPFVPIFIEENDVISGAKKILCVIRPNWDLNLVEFKKFTDGITNKLVGCFYNQSQYIENGCAETNSPQSTQRLSNFNAETNIVECYEVQKTRTTSMLQQQQQNSSNVVLVRVYGNKTDLLIDRKAETQNFLLLHSYELAPSLYATFKNGLAYEYVPGVTLNTESVLCPDIWPLVARRMAEMHRVVNINDNVKTCRTPMLWKKTQSFFELVPAQYSDPDKHNRIATTFLPISRIRDEFDQLYKHLETLNSPLVFSHNDLLLGNVIYTKSSKTVSFIDYEYADYNFQAFDIGNHFAEMCGVDSVDYTLYPKIEFQLEWIRVYLQAFHTRNDIEELDVQRLFVQVNQFALAAHIFWTVWSLIQAEHSKIDFDYVDYAYLRYNEYLARKDEFLSLKLNPSRS